MLVAIGPARRFSEAEILAARSFVDRGGIMLCTAGADRAGPIRPLLDEFSLSVPVTPLPPSDPRREPEPMGYFRTPYLDTGKYKVHMGLYAGWPVEDTGQGCETLVQGFDERPVIMSARVGRGRLFVFGDTYFAANKNLESEDGREDRVFRENAQFWRWFFAEVTDRKWTPPEPPAEPDDSDEEMTDDSSPDAASQPAPAQQPGSGQSPGKEAKP